MPINVPFELHSSILKGSDEELQAEDANQQHIGTEMYLERYM